MFSFESLFRMCLPYSLYIFRLVGRVYHFSFVICDPYLSLDHLALLLRFLYSIWFSPEGPISCYTHVTVMLHHKQVLLTRNIHMFHHVTACYTLLLLTLFCKYMIYDNFFLWLFLVTRQQYLWGEYTWISCYIFFCKSNWKFGVSLLAAVK